MVESVIILKNDNNQYINDLLSKNIAIKINKEDFNCYYNYVHLSPYSILVQFQAIIPKNKYNL